MVNSTMRCSKSCNIAVKYINIKTSVMIISHVRSFHQKDNCILLMAYIPWMSDWFDKKKNLIHVVPFIHGNKNVALFCRH